jgi:hypothetical protein
LLKVPGYRRQVRPKEGAKLQQNVEKRGIRFYFIVINVLRLSFLRQTIDYKTITGIFNLFLAGTGGEIREH